MRPPEPDDEWPPALVVLAGVGAFIGAVPGVLFGVVVLLSGGIALIGLTNPVIALVCVVLPWLLVLGAVRLMTRRSRWLLICAGLPVTAFAAWRGVHEGALWELLIVAGPALAPLLAMAPSVGRWLVAEPLSAR